MFEKNLRVAYLLDFYGDVLDSHIKDIMKAYYDDDLSLSEIALGEGISRQGVRHLIKKGEQQLELLEEKLHLAAFHNELASSVEHLEKVMTSLISENEEKFKNEISVISQVIETITSKGI